MILHSDRGSQFRCTAFVRYPTDHFGPFRPEHHPAVATGASDSSVPALATHPEAEVAGA